MPITAVVLLPRRVHRLALASEHTPGCTRPLLQLHRARCCKSARRERETNELCSPPVAAAAAGGDLSPIPRLGLRGGGALFVGLRASSAASVTFPLDRRGHRAPASIGGLDPAGRFPSVVGYAWTDGAEARCLGYSTRRLQCVTTFVSRAEANLLAPPPRLAQGVGSEKAATHPALTLRACQPTPRTQPPQAGAPRSADRPHFPFLSADRRLRTPSRKSDRDG